MRNLYFEFQNLFLHRTSIRSSYFCYKPETIKNTFKMLIFNCKNSFFKESSIRNLYFHVPKLVFLWKLYAKSIFLRSKIDFSTKGLYEIYVFAKKPAKLGRWRDILPPAAIFFARLTSKLCQRPPPPRLRRGGPMAPPVPAESFTCGEPSP